LELVLFDLDNTLLDGDSDYEWAQFLIEQGVLERNSYEHRNQEFFEQYKAGRLDIYAFLDFQLAPLAQYPRTQLDAWHAQFMALKILPIITAASRRLVTRNLQEGHLCAIVTATNSFVTAPVARQSGQRSQEGHIGALTFEARVFGRLQKWIVTDDTRDMLDRVVRAADDMVLVVADVSLTTSGRAPRYNSTHRSCGGEVAEQAEPRVGHAQSEIAQARTGTDEIHITNICAAAFRRVKSRPDFRRPAPPRSWMRPRSTGPASSPA